MSAVISIDTELEALLNNCLLLESPLVYEASAMDHGQGAELILRSESHSSLIESYDMDIGYWLTELFYTLRDENGFSWAGDAIFEISNQDGKLLLSVSFSNGSYCECLGEFETALFEDYELKLNNFIRQVRPKLSLDLVDCLFDIDCKYASNLGSETDHVKFNIFFDGIGISALTPLEQQILSTSLKSEILSAFLAWEDDVDSSNTLAWAKFEYSGSYVEDFNHSLNFSYGAVSEYPLVVQQV